MTFLIRRTDQGGGYVAPAGSHGSYTHNPLKAQQFETQEAADANRCPGNEIAVDYYEVTRGIRP